MNEFLNQIISRPKGQKIGILVFLIILLLAGEYFYFYLPKSQEIARLTDETEQAKAEKSRKQALVANIPKLQRDVRELDARLKEAVAQLPDRKEIADLLMSISNKARESGLEILLFRPKAENYQDFYAEVPVDIVVKGSFSNVVMFFDEVGRLTRLVNINNIDFKNPTPIGDRVVLETAAVATTFRFLDEPERKKIAEQKAKAAKEKK